MLYGDKDRTSYKKEDLCEKHSVNNRLNQIHDMGMDVEQTTDAIKTKRNYCNAITKLSV